jgi:hypothetical protein
MSSKGWGLRRGLRPPTAPATLDRPGGVRRRN